MPKGVYARTQQQAERWAKFNFDRRVNKTGEYVRIQNIWKRMKQRCYDSNCEDYKWYGGRGVTVCPEWITSFDTFRDWSLANGYSDRLQIDRIDNDGNYEPGNCRWVTSKVNGRNTRHCHFITFMGETKTLVEWGEQFDIETSLIRWRIRNWGVERALTTPVRKQK